MNSRPNGFNVNRDYAGGAHSYGHDVVRDHYAFHGRDVHHFGHADMARWRGGHWNHNCFDGRCGWWWFAGGIWYYYDTPVYPYPLVVPDITYAEPMPVEPATPAAPVLIAKPPPKFRYYCDNPAGYYPQVTQCNGPYHQVAASP